MQKKTNLEIINILMKSSKVDRAKVSDGEFTFQQYKERIEALTEMINRLGGEVEHYPQEQRTYRCVA